MYIYYTFKCDGRALVASGPLRRELAAEPPPGRYAFPQGHEKGQGSSKGSPKLLMMILMILKILMTLMTFRKTAMRRGRAQARARPKF